MRNSDLEWAATQLDDLSVLLQSLEYSTLAAELREAHKKLAALAEAPNESMQDLQRAS
jgi:hypothetical protein